MSAVFRDGRSTTRINIKNGLLLHYHHYSYYSQKVLMALYEKNLSFASHIIDLRKYGEYKPWYFKLCPGGAIIPILQETEMRIIGYDHIIQYLEDNFNNENSRKLIPVDQGIEVKQKVVDFKHMIDRLPVRVLTTTSIFNSEYENVYWSKLPFIGPKTGQKHKNDRIKAILEQFDKVLAEVENELANHIGDKQHWWLCSDRFTIADISLAILLHRLNKLGYESQFWTKGKRPHTEKYFARVKQRDSYKKTIPTTLIHFKVFISAYQQSLLIGLGISIVGAIGLTVGGVYLSRHWGK